MAKFTSMFQFSFSLFDITQQEILLKLPNNVCTGNFYTYSYRNSEKDS